jgi:hypothetical protein
MFWSYNDAFISQSASEQPVEHMNDSPEPQVVKPEVTSSDVTRELRAVRVPWQRPRQIKDLKVIQPYQYLATVFAANGLPLVGLQLLHHKNWSKPERRRGTRNAPLQVKHDG